MNASSPIPTGLHPSAQGCEARATLGKASHDLPQPQRGCSLFLGSGGCNPVGVVEYYGRYPRVARASQPWAESRSPVGANSQPGGLAEGSRWSFRAQGETTTGKPRRIAHPGGVPDPAPACYSVVRSNWLGSDGSGTPCRGAGIGCAITRRSPPPKPAATAGYRLATLRVDPAGRSKRLAHLGDSLTARCINLSFL